MVYVYVLHLTTRWQSIALNGFFESEFRKIKKIFRKHFFLFKYSFFVDCLSQSDLYWEMIVFNEFISLNKAFLNPNQC